jgi:glycosyltransferase involved in cell wall biosynthesis
MKKNKILLELRPAFWEGYAGIPQETRVLYKTLINLKNFETKGFLQPNDSQIISIKIKSDKKNKSKLFLTTGLALMKIEKESKNIFFIIKKIFFISINKYLLIFFFIFLKNKHSTQVIKMNLFRHYFWKKIFSKNLLSKDFYLVTEKDFYYCSVGWHFMNHINVFTKSFFPAQLNLEADIFISQTPYPAKLRGIKIHIVRYHDAIPLMFPHLISNKIYHLKQHYFGLKLNVEQGALFCCVSETTKKDLLNFYPSLKERVHVIHNSIPDFFYVENYNLELAKKIIRSNIVQKNLNSEIKFLSRTHENNFYLSKITLNKNFKYIIAAGNIEPRKNYQSLVLAWEKIKNTQDENLKLIIVGNYGWDNEDFRQRASRWISSGDIFIINSISSENLRVLYRNAEATICPSIYEGFDLSGAESMSSGGFVIASDIPAHKEIYGDSAFYFNPNSSSEMANVIINNLYGVNAVTNKQKSIEKGAEISKKYQPDYIQQQWEKYLNSINNFN